MKFQNNHKYILVYLAAAAALFSFACQKQTVEGSKVQTPTEAYQLLFTAVKAKDTDKIKQMMSKNTLALAESQAQMQKKPVEKIVENGFVATTFSNTMPEIRDERVKDEFGAIEVYNQQESKWEDTFFIKEDGGWKLAVGDLFKGNFKQPGSSKAQLEKENSNIAGNNMIPGMTNSNDNMSANTNNKVKTVEVEPENKQKK